MKLQNISVSPRIDRPHSRNVMPSNYPKRIGPFIYFDHLGPFDFPKNRPVYVPPHPHAGIATISYLFDGEGSHKDSLGNKLELEPGRVNWMNAGNGIIHSEGTSKAFANNGGRLLGFQIWIIGSDNERRNQATFQTFSKHDLPVFDSGNTQIHLIAGNYLNQSSPVKTDQELLLLAIESQEDEVVLSLDAKSEYIIYCLDGEFQFENTVCATGEGVVVSGLASLKLISTKSCKVVVAGGKPIKTEPVFNGSLVAGSNDELQSYFYKLHTEGFGYLKDERE